MQTKQVLVLGGMLAVVAAGFGTTAYSDGRVPGTVNEMVTPVMVDVAPLQLTSMAPVGTAASILDANASRVAFQALFTDVLGNPLPGATVDLAFSVYAIGGVAAIESIAAATYPMQNGLVQILLPVDPATFNGVARELGVTIKGESEMAPRIPFAAVPYAFRVDRVASRELDDDLTLGIPGTSGSLNVYSDELDALSVELRGSTGQVVVHNPLGDGLIALHGLAQIIETRDDNGIVTSLYGTDPLGGGACLLGTATGTIGLSLDGDDPNVGGGKITMFDGLAAAITLEAGSSTVRIGSPAGGASAGNLHMYPASGAPSRIHLDGAAGDLRLGLSGVSSGDLFAYSSAGGTARVHLIGGTGRLVLSDGTNDTFRATSSGAGGGGGLSLWNSAGTNTVEIDSDETDHAALRLSDASGTATISLLASGAQVLVGASGGGAEGDLHVYSASGSPSTIHLDGAGGTLRLGWPGSSSGDLFAYAAAGGNPTIRLAGSEGRITLGDTTQETIRLDGTGGGGGGGILMWNSSGVNTIELDADEADHGVIRVFNASGVAVIAMNASTGRTTTGSLRITGGSDLAEPFDVRTDGAAVSPGMVVCIDPVNPGKLVVSTKAYDRTVAGILSGAGGVNAGMIMGQTGTAADGQHPVALTGRVYVFADATDRPIEAGDLLTTSSTPGHAAAVADHARAQGAIIGKAMTPLRDGRGLILVLVSLQ